VYAFLAEHIFAPDRRKLLASQLASRPTCGAPDRNAERADMLRQAISDV